jgi:hypothetical protein
MLDFKNNIETKNNGMYENKDPGRQKIRDKIFKYP